MPHERGGGGEKLLDQRSQGSMTIGGWDTVTRPEWIGGIAGHIRLACGRVGRWHCMEPRASLYSPGLERVERV